MSTERHSLINDLALGKGGILPRAKERTRAGLARDFSVMGGIRMCM